MVITTPDSVRLSVGGYIESFYSYSSTQPANHIRQPFFFHFNRHNQVGVNLAVVQLKLEAPRVRGNIALQTGTYAQDNYAGEAPALRNLFEGYIGYALNEQQTVWLDAGLFPSNLGFESAIGIYNPTLTRSLVAENSPYFLTGAKLSSQSDKPLQWALLISNGWQRIQRVPGNQMPALGTQLSYSAGNWLFNWSTFIGSDSPLGADQLRVFNNFYVTYTTNNFNFIVGADVGVEDRATSESWYGLAAIAHWKITSNWAASLRAERFADAERLVSIAQLGSPLEVTAFSVGADKLLLTRPQLMWRSELRYLQPDQGSLVDTNTDAALAATVSLALLLE
jgi:hypothetical protein